MKRAPMVEAAAVLEVPLGRAEAVVLDVRAGRSGAGRVWLLGEDPGEVTGGPDRFRVERDGYGLTVEVDRARRTIATQGGWWYRGEYTLAAEGDHTLVTHRVYNIAGTATRWGVPLANRFFVGFGAQTRESFAETVRSIAERLDCDWRLVDPG